MSKEEKIEIIADILEVDTKDLDENMEFNEFETWDSVAVLSIIAMLDESFEKTLHASEIRDFVKINELMEIME
jgi:acyl carrier protein